jgi:hypothetical protein
MGRGDRHEWWGSPAAGGVRPERRRPPVGSGWAVARLRYHGRGGRVPVAARPPAPARPAGGLSWGGHRIWFGFTAALIAGMMTACAAGVGEALSAWQTYTLIVVGPVGFFLLQDALRAGRLVASQPGLALSNRLGRRCSARRSAAGRGSSPRSSGRRWSPPALCCWSAPRCCRVRGAKPSRTGATATVPRRDPEPGPRRLGPVPSFSPCRAGPVARRVPVPHTTDVRAGCR